MLSPTQLRCLTTRQELSGGRYELSITKSGIKISRTPDSPFIILISSVVLRVHPRALPVIPGESLIFSGAAFDVQGEYRCRFRDMSGNEAESNIAEVLNTSAIRCILPD